jgi:hypothetical protein
MATNGTGRLGVVRIVAHFSFSFFSVHTIGCIYFGTRADYSLFPSVIVTSILMSLSLATLLFGSACGG